jgi:hypothetical protein
LRDILRVVVVPGKPASEIVRRVQMRHHPLFEQPCLFPFIHRDHLRALSLICKTNLAPGLFPENEYGIKVRPVWSGDQTNCLFCENKSEKRRLGYGKVHSSNHLCTPGNKNARPAVWTANKFKKFKNV